MPDLHEVGVVELGAQQVLSGEAAAALPAAQLHARHALPAHQRLQCRH